MDNSNVRQKIMRELTNMGFNFKYIGSTYILEAIEIIYNSEDPQIIKSIENNVYPKISEKSVMPWNPMSDAGPCGRQFPTRFPFWQASALWA